MCAPPATTVLHLTIMVHSTALCTQMGLGRFRAVLNLPKAFHLRLAPYHFCAAKTTGQFTGQWVLTWFSASAVSSACLKAAMGRPAWAARSFFSFPSRSRWQKPT